MSQLTTASDYDYLRVRDSAVAIGRCLAAALTVEDLDQAIADSERAQPLGPILDPTLWRQSTDSLHELLIYLRAVRDLRCAIESFRPSQEPTLGVPDGR